MLLNVKRTQMRTYIANKVWPRGRRMVFLLSIFVAGCSGVASLAPTLLPTLSSVSPNSGTQGQTVAVTLTGTNFGPGATISVSGTGITASNVTVVSSTQITAMFAIAASAPTGPQNITVTGLGIASGVQAFTVSLLPPTVSSTNPANNVIAVPINRKITATFSKPMDLATITSATFLVTSGGSAVAGGVTYDATNNTATFAPTANLAANTAFTASITTGAKDPGGNAVGNGGSAPNPWTFTTGTTPDTTSPTVSSTNPANTATTVPINQKITAAFSKSMDSTTITATTFTLKQGATSVAGSVSYAGTIATFTPASNLAASTLYTAAITTGATDVAGNPLAGGGLAPNPWTFTTGTTPDLTAPTVVSTTPADAATGVGINRSINATFSEAIDPSTITTGTFTLAGPGTTSVNGAVSYDATSKVATFTPASNLASNATFNATITTGVKDLAGHPLATNKSWSFITGSATAGQAPVNLRSLSTFAAVAGAGLTNSNSGGQTTLNGNVGLSPTGTCLGDGVACAALDPKINGTLYANDPRGVAAAAKADLVSAYNEAAGRPPGTTVNDLSGMTLAPGVYTSGSTMSIAVNGVLTLDAKGDANAVWIFQVGSSLTVNNGAQVLLIGGAKAANVFWAIAASSTIGTNVSFKGSVLAVASNSLGTGSVVEGRMLCQSGAITLLANTVTVPAP